MPERLVLIDAFDFLHRAYHALPATLKDKRGELVNAVYGFTSMLISLVNELRPDYLVVATELRGPTFRGAEFAAYKATRVVDEKKERDFLTQVPKVERILDAFGIPHLYAQGYEADDVIGTLAAQLLNFNSRKLRRRGRRLEVVIVGNDQDLLQLVREGVKVYMPKRGRRAAVLFDERKVREVYGFSPRQVVDFKALRGDPSDNIPGVFGIGDKTAAALLERFGSLEKIYKNLGKIDPKTAKKLAEGAEQAVLSKKLATIVTDAPVSLDLAKCRFSKLDREEGISVLEEFGFRSLVARLRTLGNKEGGKDRPMGDRRSQLPLL